MSLHYYPFINRLLSLVNAKDFFKDSKNSQELFRRPFITIARLPGSMGRPIAQKVAERLGYHFIDEELIDDIAESTKKRRAIIQAVDEKSRSKFNDIVHSLLNREYVDDFTYIKELTKVILAHMCQGHVVIVGRGANFISPFERGLHVNIVAPKELRIQRTMEFDHLTRSQAKIQNKKLTDERENFIKQYFKKDIAKSVNYDLMINTACFSIDVASELVIEAFYKKFPRTLRYGSLIKT